MNAKRAWLHRDGQAAHITSLDDFVKFHRRRARPYPWYTSHARKPAQEANRLLLEPLFFLEKRSDSIGAGYYCICMGIHDAESAFGISLLAVCGKLGFLMWTMP